MSDIAVVALIIAGLLVPVSFVPPLAERLHLPESILLALVGVAIGCLSIFLLETTLTDAFDSFVKPLVNLPFTSASFLVVFLPTLLFQTALSIDVREMFEDAAPILMLAVVAVVVAAAAIGVSLSEAAHVPLAVAMLLGAIVATTDPAAVVAIFRELGTPSRLTGLVEGESLLNDAAAIVLYTVLLETIVSHHHPSLPAIGLRFGVTFLGGIAFGLVAARIVTLILPLLGGIRTAEVSLTLALPYLVFIIGDDVLDVSGVVAVVVSGLAVGATGRSRLSPESWSYLETVWEQIGFLASSLIFVLASIVVPRLLLSIGWHDIMLLVVLIVTALLARALVLFGLLPVLSALKLSQKVDHAHKAVITWGGLRGAVTLALALGVTEHPALDAATQRFVAVLATGFVLFTMLVNGLTLRPLIRLLKVDLLSPRDQALRNEIVALALADVRDTVKKTAGQYSISNDVARSVADVYDERIRVVRSEPALRNAVSDQDWITIGLVALASRERHLILDHHGRGTVAPVVIEQLLRDVDELLDEAKADGERGYLKAARHALAHGFGFRLAHSLHLRAGVHILLARQLSARFEAMQVRHLVLEELVTFTRERLRPLLGQRPTSVIEAALDERSLDVARALDALRLQYPDHAASLERRFLQQSALLREAIEYRELFDEGMIGRTLFDDLRRGLKIVRRSANLPPPLDLGLDSATLLRRADFFRDFSDADVAALAKKFRSRLAFPDEVIIRAGDRADSAFIIASGAVDVILPSHRINLGKGEFFGEMALLSGRRRQADVVSVTYCKLLVLSAAEFHRFLRSHPNARATIDRVAQSRAAMNAAEAVENAVSETAGNPP